MRADAESFRNRQRDTWAAGRVARLPARWQGRMLALHAEMLRASGEFGANTWLREASEEFGAYRIDPAATDDDIRARAKECAAAAFEHGTAYGPVSVEVLRGRLADYCRRWSVDAPGDGVEDGPAVSRMTCALWWRRKLRKIHARGVEGAAIRLGYVHRRADLYASEEAVKRRAQQKARNAETMAAVELENEAGERYTLQKLAALSTANPRIRRGELMARISGFEACARGAGHVGEFVTVTCPSRFHARLSVSGEVNPKYEGMTPRDGQSYLVGMWAKCRAALARAGVEIYGFRVAEPHHDGCPHWHFLVFMAPDLVPEFRRVLSRYALADSGEEAGATVNRVKFVSIDWQRGTAAGYIAKYVSKNIDGAEVGLDLEGRPAVESALRADAWASTWGIRQFQQIGGPGVGVWRELRRLPECAEVPELEALRRSAGDVAGGVKPDWSRFVDLMGGPVAARKDRPASVCRVSGEGKNRYGEQAGAVPYGVVLNGSGVVVKSNRQKWKVAGQVQAIGDAERADMREHSARALRALRRASGRAVGSFFDDVIMAGRGFGFQGVGEAGAPWSPVNNCTGGDRGSSKAACGSAGEIRVGAGCGPGDGRSIRGAAGGSAGRAG